MTRGEASKHLNSVLVAIDAMQDGIRGKVSNPRFDVRLNAIRDQVVLLALDLGLPLKPILKEDADAPGERLQSETG